MKLPKSLKTPDIEKLPEGPHKEYLRKLTEIMRNQHRQLHNDINQLFRYNLKSGATQAAAGAAAKELWITSGHASLPDNVIMIGA